MKQRTEATAMPMAFHLLPVAAYTGAATMTPYAEEMPMKVHGIPRSKIVIRSKQAPVRGCMAKGDWRDETKDGA